MGEKVDVLNLQGKPTGRVVEKSFAHDEGLLHGVGDVWVHKDGKILVSQRSLNKATGALRWDVSAAGHISAGETPEEGTLRELFEETGIKPNKKKLELFTMRHTKFKTDKYVKNHMVFAYALEYEGQKLKLEPKEISEVKWMSPDEILENLIEFVPYKKEYFEELIPKFKKLF